MKKNEEKNLSSKKGKDKAKKKDESTSEKTIKIKNPKKKTNIKNNSTKNEDNENIKDDKPIKVISKSQKNQLNEKVNDKKNENEDKMPEFPLDIEPKYEFNLYKHLKENIKNAEKSCTDGISNDSMYCLECKLSCCPKCKVFNIHNGHELVKKFPYYQCDNNFVNEFFKEIDSIFSLNPNYLNINKIKGELKMEINNQIMQLINQINEVKTTKLEEVDKIFMGSDNCVEKLKDNESILKKNLFQFLDNQKKFFSIDLNEGMDSEKINPEANEVLKNLEGGNDGVGMITPNLDSVNASFLMIYDLFKNIEFMNNIIRDIILDIKATTEKYSTEYDIKIKHVREEIDKLLEPFEGTFKYKDLLCDFYTQINYKIAKYNTEIENLKKKIFDKVNKVGGFSEIEKDNLVLCTQIGTNFENILNHQLIDEDEATTIRSMMVKGKKFKKYGSGVSKAVSMISLSKMKGGTAFTVAPSKNPTNLNIQKVFDTPDEIKLNKDVLQTFFNYETLNMFKNNFKKKKEEYYDIDEYDGEVDIVKPIPATNEMQCYDKKSRMVVRKAVKFDKKVHKYLYFLNGCRTILVKDRLYILGGVDKEKNVTNLAYVYYIRTNELKTMPDMIYPHAYHSVEFLDYYKSIVVIGGENIGTCEIYDMHSGIWRKLPDMKVPRAHCGIYLDKINNSIYSFFGVIGSITEKNNYTDVVECLELRKIALGWYKIDYNNKAEMDFKSGINKILPLTPDMVLIYGATNIRDFAKKSAVYSIPKQEMMKIDNKIFNEIREASKNSKKLSSMFNSI